MSGIERLRAVRRRTAFGDQDEVRSRRDAASLQRAVALAWVMSGLSDNGGFASWIESAGHRTPEARAALAQLGASEYVPC